MILTKLTDYYHKLSTQIDETTGTPKVPPYGFSDEKIGYILVLSEQGELVGVTPHLSDDKKPVPKLMSVPRPEKRTSGIKPNFLWDKTAYVLGVETTKDKKQAKDQPISYSQATFDAFKTQHLERLAQTDDIGLKALCLFLQKWQPEDFLKPPCKLDMLDMNVVFKLEGQSGYLHQTENAQNLWSSMLVSDDSENGLCLITGEDSPLARLHPAIKGVFGGQSSGGSIISFNKEAFTSYGKEQGANSPVSERAAFAYTTALNYLLRRENRHCLSIGDTSTVFWAETQDTQSAVEFEDVFACLMDINDDDAERNKVFALLEQVAKGRPLKEINPELDEKTKFYILGLAPNAARISIRFWLDTTFGELTTHLAQHWQDLQIEPLAWKTGHEPSLWRLLVQTAALGKSENISPHLAGEMMRSIITGALYPSSVLSQLITRIRADGDMNGLRISLIKAILQRRFRKGFIQEEIPMALNIESENTAYLLGRLFAVLERIQNQALGDLNAGIGDRYYGSASALPFSVYPRLLKGAKNHLGRLRKDKPGMAVNLEKEMGEILTKINDNFPRRLSLDEQGRFAIAYYQQKQQYFVKKSTDAITETE